MIYYSYIDKTLISLNLASQKQILDKNQENGNYDTVFNDAGSPHTLEVYYCNGLKIEFT